jgi:bifunctional DNA-binding transcriptional regulator/antitoxin component of YhaV-PrlF toxin-antitoxin module
MADRATRRIEHPLVVNRRRRITIPASVLEEADLEIGDELTIWADGPGRIVLEDNPIRRFAGALTHCYEPGALDRLRDEWERPNR